MTKREPPVIRRMKQADVNTILRELTAWEKGQREGILTWDRLVKFSGFSRQTLWAKETIRARFDALKRARRSKAPARPIVRTIDERIEKYEVEIQRLKAIINKYDELWARIEYNARVMGVDTDALRRPLRPLAREVTRRPRRR